MKREDIHIIARNSNWKENDIDQFLKKSIYNDKSAWLRFLELFFLSVGVALSVAGILFFFAYNWDDLHKFVKIGLIEGLIIALTLVAVFTKIKPLYKNIILTGTTVLVGVLFAVFGQIYQTGANAYDFFLGWTMAVALWVIVSNFTPLWLVFILLINITFGLYVEQVASNWNDIFTLIIFSLINTLFLVIALFLKNLKFKIPNWFTNLIALSIAFTVTSAMFNGIFDRNKLYIEHLIILTVVLYAFGTYYALKKKQSFYIAIISFSIIMIVAAILVKQITFKEYKMFLIIGFFIVGSVTLVIKILMHLQSKWNLEQKVDNLKKDNLY